MDGPGALGIEQAPHAGNPGRPYHHSIDLGIEPVHAVKVDTQSAGIVQTSPIRHCGHRAGAGNWRHG